EGGAATASARATLAIALQVQLRLLAPFLPYVTEEVWSWWQEGSIHLAPWPTQVELGSAAAADPAMVDAVAAALVGLRGAKSQAKVSMRAELSRVEITGPETLVRAAELAAGDLRRTGKITGDLVFTVDEGADALTVAAELAPTDCGGAAPSGAALVVVAAVLVPTPVVALVATLVPAVPVPGAGEVPPVVRGVLLPALPRVHALLVRGRRAGGRVRTGGRRCHRCHRCHHGGRADAPRGRCGRAREVRDGGGHPLRLVAYDAPQRLAARAVGEDHRTGDRHGDEREQRSLVVVAHGASSQWVMGGTAVSRRPQHISESLVRT
ncbi:MAG: class I tRNA ligase family protein, partial [Nocardioides sp.]